MNSKTEELSLARAVTSSLELAVGGRENLTEILSTEARDGKQDILFRMLMDPKRRHDSLSKICRDAGVSAAEVLGMFRDATLARSLANAQVTLAEKLEGIVRDVAQKAADHTTDCECVWLSESGNPDLDCEKCRGKGTIFKEGSLKHAETVLRATELVKTGGGVNVNVRQNVGVSMGGSLLDSFVKATDEAAFDVIDAEVEEAPDA